MIIKMNQSITAGLCGGGTFSFFPISMLLSSIVIFITTISSFLVVDAFLIPQNYQNTLLSSSPSSSSTRTTKLLPQMFAKKIRKRGPSGGGNDINGSVGGREGGKGFGRKKNNSPQKTPLSKSPAPAPLPASSSTISTLSMKDETEERRRSELYQAMLRTENLSQTTNNQILTSNTAPLSSSSSSSPPPPPPSSPPPPSNRRKDDTKGDEGGDVMVVNTEREIALLPLERRTNLYQTLLRDLQIEDIPLLSVDSSGFAPVVYAAAWSIMSQLLFELEEDQKNNIVSDNQENVSNNNLARKTCLIVEDASIDDDVLRPFVRVFNALKSSPEVMKCLPELDLFQINLLGMGVGPALVIEITDSSAALSSMDNGKKVDDISLSPSTLSCTDSLFSFDRRIFTDAGILPHPLHKSSSSSSSSSSPSSSSISSIPIESSSGSDACSILAALWTSSCSILRPPKSTSTTSTTSSTNDTNAVLLGIPNLTSSWERFTTIGRIFAAGLRSCPPSSSTSSSSKNDDNDDEAANLLLSLFHPNYDRLSLPHEINNNNNADNGTDDNNNSSPASGTFDGHLPSPSWMIRNVLVGEEVDTVNKDVVLASEAERYVLNLLSYQRRTPYAAVYLGKGSQRKGGGGISYEDDEGKEELVEIEVYRRNAAALVAVGREDLEAGLKIDKNVGL